ncbi:hypothetical protein G6F70_008893 [Rhizopus microsporus]|nr:hypothetical protein G6F71_008865 [Rhizopus microsporus]KAG1194263.1 hypothetical protein G6F70_008893 [Rhizopus microsporus]KAG1206365.1 hypothetical protein G6F69_008890 [Rhizopus microsporus]KAG1226723.1 hypothetical protein G6F67_008847 [Rhizopus microsporus]KAG1258089.1 hypothetical protein G6F68_008961 [Rhizopus microsporus]
MSSLDNNNTNDSKLKSSKKRALRRELATLQEDNNKKARRDSPKCPVCEHRIEPAYWNEHYQYELSRLAEPNSEVYSDKSKGKRGAAVVARKQMERTSGKKRAGSVYEETLERIQKNRQKRTDILKHLDNKQQRLSDSEIALQLSLEEEQEIQTCFICNQQIFGDLEAINLHIDNCLSNAQEPPSSSSTTAAAATVTTTTTTTDNPESSDAWVEYEWAGQRRVRASAMMEGGYSGAGFATASKREVEDEDDEDLDVEDDDAAQYGEHQYTERDILVNMEDDNEDAHALREMVSGGTSHNSPSSIRQEFEETVSETGWEQHLSTTGGFTEGGHSKLVIESLKTHIRQLEAASRSSPHCLICLEPYKTPLTSIVCWHVHCERCWLQTLGSKKLCPQCQKITTAADLRRIYI